MRKLTIMLLLPLLLSGCMKPTDEIILLPVKNSTIPEVVLSAEEQATLSQYIPIHEGSEPPNVEGDWLASPMTLTFASDGYAGEFYDLHWRLERQNERNFAIYKEWQGDASALGKEAHVIGSGDDFTVYTVERSENAVRGWSCEQVTLVSGTKSEAGIKGYSYAIVMRNKTDERGVIIEPDSYRVFTDGDGISSPITSM